LYIGSLKWGREGALNLGEGFGVGRFGANTGRGFGVGILGNEK
jgi:hypothetical protein